MALTIVMNDEWEDTGKDENMGWIRRIGRDETSDGKDDQTETIGWMMEHLRRMKKDEMIGRMSQMMMQMISNMGLIWRMAHGWDNWEGWDDSRMDETNDEHKHRDEMSVYAIYFVKEWSL